MTSRRVSPCTRYIRLYIPSSQGRRSSRIYIVKGSVGLGGERDAGGFGGEGVHVGPRRNALDRQTL